MFILTDKERKTGLMLSEYNKKLDIIYGYQKEDEFRAFWAYRQNKYKGMPNSTKPMPHGIKLGTPEQARLILKTFLEEIERKYFGNDNIEG